jgi:phage gp29-like protein
VEIAQIAEIALAQSTPAHRHRTVTASYLPEKQPAPATAPPAGRIEVITTPSFLDYTDTHVGYKLTPDTLNWILREADYGYPMRMYDAFQNAVLGDGHTRGLYEQRLDELCVDFTWRSGDARPNSVKAAELVTEATSDLDLGGAIEHLGTAFAFGSSYAELPWFSRSDGLQVPGEIVCVPHRRFIFDYLTSTPHLTTNENTYPGETLQRRPGSSWMRAETKRWPKQVQAGALRTVIWWTMFKRMNVRDWLIFAEKYGLPMIIGRYGNDDSPEQRAALKKTIQAIGQEGQAVLGGTATIEILNQALRSSSGGGEHLHASIVQLANSEISKVITAGTLTSDTGGPGSFALGQVHADQKHKLSLADAKRIGRVFQRDLGLEFLRRNNIKDAAPPFLNIHVSKLSLLADSQVLGNLAQAGIPISISQMQEKFELRAPLNDADTLKPIAPKVASNADPASVADPATAPS